MNERTGGETSEPQTSELNDPSRKLPRELTSSGTTNDPPNDSMNETRETNERSGRRGKDMQGVGIGGVCFQRLGPEGNALSSETARRPEAIVTAAPRTTRILEFGTLAPLRPPPPELWALATQETYDGNVKSGERISYLISPEKPPSDTSEPRRVLVG
jgi:hypothetical protein